MENLLQSDEERSEVSDGHVEASLYPGWPTLDPEDELVHQNKDPGHADQSSLQAEMRRVSICSVLADQTPAANSTFHDVGRYETLFQLWKMTSIQPRKTRF